MTWKAMPDEQLKVAATALFKFEHSSEDFEDLSIAMEKLQLNDQTQLNELTLIIKNHMTRIFFEWHKKRPDFENEAKHYDQISAKAKELHELLMDSEAIRNHPLASHSELPSPLSFLAFGSDMKSFNSDYLLELYMRSQERASNLRTDKAMRTGNLIELDTFCCDLVDFLERESGKKAPISTTAPSTELLMCCWNLIYKNLKQIAELTDLKPAELLGDAALRSLQRREAVRKF